MNDSKDSAFLKDIGSEFHRCGPQTLKDLLPIFKLVFGTTSRLRSLDLKFRGGTYGVKRSDKYCGPNAAEQPTMLIGLWHITSLSVSLTTDHTFMWSDTYVFEHRHLLISTDEPRGNCRLVVKSDRLIDIPTDFSGQIIHPHRVSSDTILKHPHRVQFEVINHVCCHLLDTMCTIVD